MMCSLRFGLNAVVKTTAYIKKLNSENLIKIIEQFKSVIINTNFLFYPLLNLFIGIYYDKSKSFNYLNYLL